MKHISEMTWGEMSDFQNAIENAAIKFAKEKGFSGLSHHGWFNFYGALQCAIEREYLKAKTGRHNEVV